MAQRRVLIRVALAVAVLLCRSVGAFADGFPKTLVKVATARVYEKPDLAAPVRLTLGLGTMVEVRHDDGTWCDVMVTTGPSGGTIDAWMRTADLLRSPGMEKFWNHGVAQAGAMLESEARDAPDPTLAAWLRFFLGYSQWATGHFDQARATFGAIARRQPAARFSADAFVAEAKVASVQGDVGAALTRYEQMLATCPKYVTAPYRFDPALNPYPVGWDHDSELTGGSDAIPKRVQALRALIAVKTSAERDTADPGATRLRKSAAWLALGRAWEAKNEVDPGETMLTGTITVNKDAQKAYEAAVAAAPGSAPAGSAAWQLIAFSGPYEWEGDWQGESNWMIKHYGRFLSDYPGHELAPDAKFNVAKATWAKGGYTEVLGYVFDPDGWDAIRKRESFLDQWFDTKGFGGGTFTKVTAHPEEAAKAQQMFREIATASASAPSAAMSQYYVAVIFDYCLNQPAKALPEYETFVAKYPKTGPFVDKARKRIAAIRAGG